MVGEGNIFEVKSTATTPGQFRDNAIRTLVLTLVIYSSSLFINGNSVIACLSLRLFYVADDTQSLKCPFEFIAQDKMSYTIFGPGKKVLLVFWSRTKCPIVF